MLKFVLVLLIFGNLQTQNFHFLRGAHLDADFFALDSSVYLRFLDLFCATGFLFLLALAGVGVPSLDLLRLERLFVFLAVALFFLGRLAFLPALAALERDEERALVRLLLLLGLAEGALEGFLDAAPPPLFLFRPRPREGLEAPSLSSRVGAGAMT
ncbi:hypothetical protein IscW_ISCW015804 [Ixodes scapularis]|uniref:Uncharacterized protein n=1 Tax=Ixodes scapularis TaxID=6945 RepID=B7P3W4_IXOSC|nr:hypothetical protein IscW_ISCW015804 [Ixodes scapularis]|eukprot:XP_002404699.1 hypothetical protein IscW_ISCW015804 [Ixodes scapularis]